MQPNLKTTPITLTIAGSDSGGGAGIQADIKSISATGGYACSVITALTAQNSIGVDGVMTVEPSFIRAQLDSIFKDFSVQAVKIGMLADAATIHCVAQAMIDYKPKFVVLDPVMVATSGDRLLEEAAEQCLLSELIPLADIITPNLYEALVLLGRNVNELPNNFNDFSQLAEDLKGLHCKNILLKGGHLHSAKSVDIWCTSSNNREFFSAPRIQTKNTHGTGCSLSSAIASYLAQGYKLSDAIQQAKSYISKAIEASNMLSIGHGPGPINHFYMLDAVINDTQDLDSGNE